MIHPRIQVLETATIERIVDEAYQILADPGVILATERPLQVLAAAGASVDHGKGLARLPARLIDQARQTVPASIVLHDLAGRPRLTTHGDHVYFYPASTGKAIWDARTDELRPAVTADLVRYIKVAEGLPNCDAQSSAFYCHDVPAEVADSYRLYLLLKYATKPLITGAFSVAGQQVEIDMLRALRGGATALAEKPLAVMVACPSPPLKWTFTADFLLMCAEAMVPIGIGPMPQAGATAPATLIGTLVQHTAEALSGLVLSQLAQPGAPIYWLCPTGVFDMRYGTMPMGAMETLLIACGTTEIGKYLNVPTHNYMGVSDAKTVDAQYAMETTAGILLAQLCRSNLNESLGMLDFEGAQSAEGLVISHEAVGMARRLEKGIDDRMPTLGLDIIRAVGHSGSFLESEHTLQWYRREFFHPDLMDRRTEHAWRELGAKDMLQRARARVAQLEASYVRQPLPAGVEKEIDAIMQRAAAPYGMEKLPVS